MESFAYYVAVGLAGLNLLTLLLTDKYLVTSKTAASARVSAAISAAVFVMFARALS